MYRMKEGYWQLQQKRDQVIYKCRPIRITDDLSTESMKAKVIWKKKKQQLSTYMT